MTMDINEAIKKLLGKRVHFKNGTTNITIEKVDKILPPDELYDPKTKDHLYIVEGEIEEQDIVEGVIVQVYVYPYTEIFMKIAGDKKKHTGATTSHTMPLGPFKMSENEESHYSTT